VSLTAPEFQKIFKAILPSILIPVPDKANPVEAFFAFYRQIVFAITLGGYPLA
jgi:hypothetical protein